MEHEELLELYAAGNDGKKKILEYKTYREILEQNRKNSDILTLLMVIGAVIACCQIAYVLNGY